MSCNEKYMTADGVQMMETVMSSDGDCMHARIRNKAACRSHHSTSLAARNCLKNYKNAENN